MRNAERHALGTGLDVLVDLEAVSGNGRGIFFCAAETISAESVNNMATHGRGIVGAVLSAERAHALGIPSFAGQKIRPTVPLFITSVEGVACMDTGISADERAVTLRSLGAAVPRPDTLNTPGHIIPNVARSRLGPDASLSDAAYQYMCRESCDVLAWCDILDDMGDVACAIECLAMAELLDARAILWRRSTNNLEIFRPEHAALAIAAE